MFSKFDFKNGKYDTIGLEIGDVSLAKFYAHRMAIETKVLIGKGLYKLFLKEISNKD